MLPKYSQAALSTSLHGLVFKVFLNLLLVSLYVYCFGIESFQRYREKSIATIKKNIDISSAASAVKPGIAILPMDPDTGLGWKSTNASHLRNATHEKLRSGLEELSYQFEEIVLSSRYNVSHYTLLSDSYRGLVQILETQVDHFTFSPLTSQALTLNSSLRYFLAFLDPSLAVVSGNPGTVPRTLLSLSPSAGTVYVYLNLILHMNLDRESSPCDDTPHYNYGRCLNENVANAVGCRSFWMNVSHLPVCSDYPQYTKYANKFERLISMERSELLAETGCRRPCTYMEYSFADDPIPTVAQNQTMVVIIFSSRTVTVEKEELAFSFGSLIADVGGVLGLFIGFNFLQGGELLFIGVKMIFNRYAS